MKASWVGRNNRPCRASPPNAAARPRSKPAKPGSPSASRISRARSARKLRQKKPSPSFAPGVVADHGGGDEFVGLAARIGCRHRFGGTGRLGRPRPCDHRRVGARHPFPAVVAVHREVAPDTVATRAPSGSPAISCVDETRRRLRRHVAPVGDGVQRDRHARRRRSARAGGKDMVDVAMHAAVRDHPHQMRGAARGLQRLDEGQHRGIAERTCRSSMARSICAKVHRDDAARRRYWCGRPRNCPSAPRAGRHPGRWVTSVACGQVAIRSGRSWACGPAPRHWPRSRPAAPSRRGCRAQRVWDRSSGPPVAATAPSSPRRPARQPGAARPGQDRDRRTREVWRASSGPALALRVFGANDLPRADRPGAPHPFFKHRLPSTSAICTALSAAPFLRLSDTHHRFRPFSIVESWRIRLTKVA